MIVNYAKNFIKEYEVESIDTNSLKRVISKLGYSIVVYNPLSDYNYNIAAIIDVFNIDNELKNTCCFTCTSEIANCIFIRDGIEEKEFIHLLLHEICHIYMHHVDKNVVANSTYYEYEANKFADDLKRYVKQQRKRRKILHILPFLFLPVFVIVCILLNNKSDKSNEFDLPTENIPAVITDATAELPAKAPTEDITEHIDIDNEALYYVSSGGTKYHLKDCYQINPNNCSALPLKQVLEMGYTPCKTCRPDKQN